MIQNKTSETAVNPFRRGAFSTPWSKQWINNIQTGGESTGVFSPKLSIAWWRNDVLNHMLVWVPDVWKIQPNSFVMVWKYLTLCYPNIQWIPCFTMLWKLLFYIPVSLMFGQVKRRVKLLLPRYSRCFGPCSQRGFLRVILHRVISVMSDASLILYKNDWLVISSNCLMFDAVCLIDGLQQL